MKRINLSQWALEHQPLVRYLLVVLLIGGVFGFTRLGQDEDPPFTFRAMIIQAYWPGASAKQIGEQVTDKLEKKLQEVPHVDKIRSYSKPGETLIMVQLRDSSPAKEVANIWYQVRKKIGDVRGTLPPGVQGPFFNDEFGDTFGVIFAFSADGFNYRELKDHVEYARQELLRVKNVAKVEWLGVQEEKIYLDFSHKKLSQLGLNVGQIAQQLSMQNAVESTGVLVLPNDNVQIRISGALQTLEDVRNLPLRSTGAQAASLRLGDVANVSRGYADPPFTKMRFNGQEVIGLGVSMAKGGDIIELGQELATVRQRIQSALPIGVDMMQVADQPRAVSSSVKEFIQALIEAVVIVLAVSFLSLGLHTKPFRIDMRPGLVVGLTIPLVLAVTFLSMYLLGIDLHKISLGALIISLGLLVDDAIIAVEMMVRKMEEGYDKVRAATFAYDSTAWPMLTGTLITAAGFLPIALAKSTAGEYTFSIFAVTTLALLISWVAAVVFVPYLGYLLLKAHPIRTGETRSDVFDTPFYQRFRRLVDRCVEWRKTVIVLTLLSFVLGGYAFKYIEQQFFPDSSRPEIMIDLWLPEGSSFAATEAQAQRFEKWLAQQKEVGSYTTYVGTGAPRFYLPLDQQFPQTNLAQLVVVAKDISARDALRTKVNALFVNDFPSVRSRVKFLPNGPPVPYPVQFRVEGPEAGAVRRIADHVKTVMRRNPHTVGVNDNWNENIKVLDLQLDQDKARALGISTQALAQASHGLLTGTTLGQFREGKEFIDIVIRPPADERGVLSRLADANVPTASGQSVPLSQLAQPRLAWEPGVVWRENRNFAITVQSEIKPGIQGPTVTEQIQPELALIRSQLPAGYRIVMAGAAEESGKAQESIAANVPLMMFIVFTLLMLQLHSFSRTLLVYLTGPLGIIGAALALLLFQRPFGFVAQLGVIALLGMIIRNSVILVDQIEQEIRAGIDPWTAIVESAIRRARPILLTAAASVLAMIPLSRSVFWGPMAVAIMGGLVVATLLTLLFLPALYAACFRVKRKETPA